MPCADCGRMMYRCPDSLGEGLSRCQPCRRANPAPKWQKIRRERAAVPVTEWPGRASPADRGYGHLHRAARLHALSIYQPDDPCARCGEALGTDTSRIHLDHTDDREGYLGLSHRRCNLAAAAALTNGTAFTPKVRYAPRDRTCERCLVEYKASYGGQRFCGRPCAIAYQKETAPPKPKGRRAAISYTRTCSECPSGFITIYPNKMTCSTECSRARQGRTSRDGKRARYVPVSVKVKARTCIDCAAAFVAFNPRRGHVCDRCQKRRSHQAWRRNKRERERLGGGGQGHDDLEQSTTSTLALHVPLSPLDVAGSAPDPDRTPSVALRATRTLR